MYKNEYATPNGARYEGCGEWPSFAEAMQAGLDALKWALPGTKWLGANKQEEAE